MKRLWRPLLILLVIGLVGCSDDKTDPVGTADSATDDFTAIDFDEPYGGLTKSDEDFAFNDPYLIQDDAQAADQEFDDELLSDPEVQALIDAGENPEQPGDPEQRPRFTYVRMVWGNLDAMPEEDGSIEDGDIVDWSGMLRVDRGHVIVRRVIRFERPHDSIVRPRIDRQTAAWFSHTGGHFDGLMIQIIEPPRRNRNGEEGNDEPLPPNVMHFETPAFSQDFVIDELPGLDEIYEVEPAGNAIHFTGFNLSDIDPCPKGFCSGLWFDDTETEEEGGTFRGRWVGLHGQSMGHMMGAYGLNEEGERVFFGKYISRNGQFMGLLAGHWAPADEPGHGWLRGHWVSEQDETIEGVISARFMTLPERPGGFYQGRWTELCDEEAEEEIDR